MCRKERQGLCPAFRILYSWILKLLRNFAVSAVLWSIIWLLPISKSAMASISSLEREKFQILRFSWILSSWVDFGIMITPRSIFHRSAICAAMFQLKAQRRWRDLNPRAAINDLHPFQGCPFGQLGYFSMWQNNSKFSSCSACRPAGRMAIHTMEARGFHNWHFSIADVPYII